MRIITAIIVLAFSLFLIQCAQPQKANRVIRTIVEGADAMLDEVSGSAYESDKIADGNSAIPDNESASSSDTASLTEQESSGINMMPVAGAPSEDSGRFNEDLIPNGWPEYVPIMDGFVIKYSSSDNQRMNIVAFGSEPVESVTQFYKNLPGWTLSNQDPAVTRDSSVDSDTLIESFTLRRNAEALTVNIFEAENGSAFQIIYKKS